MKVLILDDDMGFANLIEKLLLKYFEFDFTFIQKCYSLDEALTNLSKEKYDLLLFDIELGLNNTSFEIIEKIPSQNHILIFITGHEKFGVKAIKTNAFDYILKPIQPTEFKDSITRAIKHFYAQKPKVNQLKTLQEQNITIKTLDHIHFVEIKKIIYVEASGSYTTLYTDIPSKIVVSKKLKDFENKLTSAGFFRIHHSYLINVLKINTISKKDGSYVLMEDLKKLPIATRKKDGFMLFLKQTIEI